MPRKPGTSPRKLPSQARSRAMVDAILSATERVLVREGYEGTSTNRVAEVAGVSVGSLYQYFPSKEALVMEVMERHCQHVADKLEARLAALASSPVAEVTDALVREMIALHQVNPRLHRVLVEQVPRIGKLSRIDEMRRHFASLVARYLEAHRDEINVEDFELTAYLLVTSEEQLIDTVLRERIELLQSDELRASLVRLALNYLEPRRRAVGVEGGRRADWARDGRRA